MQLLHQSGDIIASRYRIFETLGQGGVGITYKAIDLQNSQFVALKALSLRRMTDWKVLELFEREARILAQLNHPAIPRYLDYFSVDTEQERSFYIVQQLAEGKSLAYLVEKGWHPDEENVRHLASLILKILVYLQSFAPPVIHRDIKPQNIILSSPPQSPPYQEGARGGQVFQEEARGVQVFLVDFGAVQDTYHNTLTGGSTVVGTFGYMAPEQFRGQAVLSTDVYGLGTTLLYILTGKSPADLPQRQLKIDFRSQVRLSQEFADWLERTLEPLIEDRFSDAKEALAVLQGKRLLAPKRAHKLCRPKNTPITLTKLENQLLINIPPVWSRSPTSVLFTLLHPACSGFVVSIFLTILAALNDHNGVFYLILFVYLPISLPILCLFGWLMLMPLMKVLWSDAFGTRLVIKPETFSLQRWWLGLWRKKTKQWFEDVNQVELISIPLPVLAKRMTLIKLDGVFPTQQKQKWLIGEIWEYHFGLFLTRQEKEWLVGEIRAFLEKQCLRKDSTIEESV